MKVNKKSSDFTNFDIGATQEAQDNASAITEATSTKYNRKDIPVEDIVFNPNNTIFSKMDTDETISELAKSIEDRGLLTPITVFKYGDKYMLISGERRTKAYMLLNRRTIPANIFEDAGELENTARLYDANLQSRELDSRARFFAIKDLLDKYKNSDIPTEKLARMVNVTRQTFLRHKKAIMNAEDGDIALFESGDITLDELVEHTTEIIKKRNNAQDPYNARIDIISKNIDEIETVNYKNAETNAVYSVECDEKGLYCIAKTDAIMYKVPLHDYGNNQVYNNPKQAQVSLNIYAISEGLVRYDGDFSEYKMQSVSPIPTPEATKAEADSETSASEAPDPNDYAPTLMETIPTQKIGEESEDSEDKTEDAVDNKSYVTSESEPEEDTDEDRDVEVSESDVTVEVSKDTDAPSNSSTEGLESSKTEEVPSTATPAKSDKADYLDRIVKYRGYSPVTKTWYEGTVYTDPSTGKIYIVTYMNVSSTTKLDKALFQTLATAVEVEKETLYII